MSELSSVREQLKELSRSLFGYRTRTVNHYVDNVLAAEENQLHAFSQEMQRLAVEIARSNERQKTLDDLINHVQLEYERLKLQLEREGINARYAEEGARHEIHRLEESHYQRISLLQTTQKHIDQEAHQQEHLIWKMVENLTRVMQEAQAVADRELNTISVESLWNDFVGTLLGDEHPPLTAPETAGPYLRYRVPDGAISLSTRNGEVIGFLSSLLMTPAPPHIIGYHVVSSSSRPLGFIPADDVQVLRHKNIMVKNHYQLVSEDDLVHSKPEWQSPDRSNVEPRDILNPNTHVSTPFLQREMANPRFSENAGKNREPGESLRTQNSRPATVRSGPEAHNAITEISREILSLDKGGRDNEMQDPNTHHLAADKVHRTPLSQGLGEPPKPLLPPDEIPTTWAQPRCDVKINQEAASLLDGENNSANLSTTGSAHPITTGAKTPSTADIVTSRQSDDPPMRSDASHNESQDIAETGRSDRQPLGFDKDPTESLSFRDPHPSGNSAAIIDGDALTTTAPSWFVRPDSAPETDSRQSIDLPGVHEENPPQPKKIASTPVERETLYDQELLPGIGFETGPDPVPAPSWTNTGISQEHPAAPSMPPVKNAPTASETSPLDFVNESGTLDVRTFLFGKRVGQDIIDNQQQVVAHTGEVISPDLVQRVEQAGFLPDLIVHMIF